MNWDQIRTVAFLRDLAEKHHARSILVTKEVFERLTHRVIPGQIDHTPGSLPGIWITPYTEVTIPMWEESKVVIDLTGEEMTVRE